MFKNLSSQKTAACAFLVSLYCHPHCSLYWELSGLHPLASLILEPQEEILHLQDSPSKNHDNCSLSENKGPLQNWSGKGGLKADPRNLLTIQFEEA